MITPKIPQNEELRQAALNEFDIIDTLSEQEYDNITRIAAKILDVPICLISLVDNDRQWFKSRVGLEASETSRDVSFCAHAINYEDVFVVNNTLEDERFFDNPLVTSGPNIQFYAGSQLKTEDGFNIGTLCAIDSKPRELSEEDKELLKVLSNNVVTLIELRKKNKALNLQINETLLINSELKTLIKEKEKTVNSVSKGGESSLTQESEFDIKTSLAFAKSSVLSEFVKNKNKILYQQDSLKLKIDKSTFELLIYNLLLLQNNAQVDNMIQITFHKEARNIIINIKNLYVMQWVHIVKENNLSFKTITDSVYMQEAAKYAKMLGASINIPDNLNKGFSIDVKI